MVSSSIQFPYDQCATASLACVSMPYGHVSSGLFEFSFVNLHTNLPDSRQVIGTNTSCLGSLGNAEPKRIVLASHRPDLEPCGMYSNAPTLLRTHRVACCYPQQTLRPSVLWPSCQSLDLQGHRLHSRPHTWGKISIRYHHRYRRQSHRHLRL